MKPAALVAAGLLLITSCASSSSGDDATSQPASPIPEREGWTVVDHPVVVAVRSSVAVEPSTHALDGSLETSWVSGLGPPQWIELDLGEPMEISRIRLTVDQTSAGFTVHRIHAGAHDNPGRLAASLEGDTTDGDVLEADIGYEVEFIRILTTASASTVAWVEIEIDLAD